MERVRRNNRAGPASQAARAFLVGGTTLGRVLPRFAELLGAFPDVFEVTDEAVVLLDRDSWQALPHAELVDRRTSAVAGAVNALRATDSVPALRGWRDEAFAVRQSLHAPAELIIERAAAPL